MARVCEADDDLRSCAHSLLGRPLPLLPPEGALPDATCAAHAAPCAHTGRPGGWDKVMKKCQLGYKCGEPRTAAARHRHSHRGNNLQFLCTFFFFFLYFDFFVVFFPFF